MRNVFTRFYSVFSVVFKVLPTKMYSRSVKVIVYVFEYSRFYEQIKETYILTGY